MSEVVRHYAPGSVPISRPASNDSWRIVVHFVDDPASYEQVVLGTDLEGAQAHLPITVDSSGHLMRELVRVTYTRV